MFEASVIGEPKIQLTMSAEEATKLMCLIGEFGGELELSNDLYDVLANTLGGINVTGDDRTEELRSEAQNAILVRADIIREIR